MLRVCAHDAHRRLRAGRAQADRVHGKWNNNDDGFIILLHLCTRIADYRYISHLSPHAALHGAVHQAAVAGQRSGTGRPTRSVAHPDSRRPEPQADVHAARGQLDHTAVHCARTAQTAAHPAARRGRAQRSLPSARVRPVGPDHVAHPAVRERLQSCGAHLGAGRCGRRPGAGLRPTSGVAGRGECGAGVPVQQRVQADAEAVAAGQVPGSAAEVLGAVLEVG